MHTISNLFYFGKTLYMLYAFFWVIPRRLNFIFRRFGTLYLFHLLPMKMGHIECSETPACRIQTPGNYPEESIQHSEHGASLKSRTLYMFRTVSPSIIRSLRLYIEHQVYVIQVLWLLGSGNVRSR